MWNGAFANPFYKSVDDVSFVALPQMTADDWRFLDWRNLRPVAKNRIADAAFEKDLIGFLDVRVTNKAAKPRYLWPGRKGYVENMAPGSHEFFRYEPDEDIENDRADFIDDFIFRVNRGPDLLKDVIRFGIRTAVVLAAKQAFAEWQTKEEIEKHLESLEKEEPYSAALATVILLLMGFNQQEIENFLDEVDPDFIA